MGRYFVHDLESGRLHIHTGGKADWLALPETQRSEIKRACLWSKSRACWISRGQAGSWSAHHLRELLPKLGFEDRGTTGEKLTFAEQVEATQARAEARADRFEDRADAANERGTELYQRAHTMADAIPFGQPILVGHYSERRDRNYRERIHNTFGRAFGEMDKAKHYASRAATARATAEGAQFSDPAYLDRRIRECQAEIARLDRYLAGKYFGTAAAERRNAEACGVSPDRTVSDAERERLEAARAEEQDKLGFLRHCLETCGRTVYTRETLRGKTAVKLRGRWEPIVRLNPTTVAVPNICFPEPADQRRYALKYAYAEVQDSR